MGAMHATLFDSLDLDHDGHVSRAELHTAARALKWDWYEAPFFALLDLFTIPGPLSRKRFAACMRAIRSDPLGPYGHILHTPPFWTRITGCKKIAAKRRPGQRPNCQAIIRNLLHRLIKKNPVWQLC
jgi:hypothetical protein